MAVIGHVPARESSPFAFWQMKYKILKALDVVGLKVLSPIVRLMYGEEPREQARQIGLFLVIPALTFCGFVALWAFIAPRHKTKSGEVPTPSVVLDAYDGIVLFHDREYAKLADFQRSGEDRTRQLAVVRERMAQREEESKDINRRFADFEAKHERLLAVKLTPYEKALANQQQKYAKAQAERTLALEEFSAGILPSDGEAKIELKQRVRADLDARAAEQAHLKSLRSQLAEMRGEKWSQLEAIRSQKNAIDQERQFLAKRLAYLTNGNRENRVVAGLKDIKEKEERYAMAEGQQAFALAAAIVRSEERVKKMALSEYAKPPTFFDQISTSVKCVFTGFLIASVIAIPVGVLCGLNQVFMASMMPLISLFKPVSPIVWLPIVFIIVGGFIDNPEEAWVAPAFLSTAITVALCSLWPTLVNTALGVASIDQDHLNVARVLRLGFWSRLFKIVIPSALPLIFAGLRISLGVGWMVLIAGELLSSSPGLGKFVWDMFNNGSSETFAQMFVVVFFVGVIGLLLDRIMIVFQRLVTFDGAPTAI